MAQVHEGDTSAWQRLVGVLHRHDMRRKVLIAAAAAIALCAVCAAGIVDARGSERLVIERTDPQVETASHGEAGAGGSSAEVAGDQASSVVVDVSGAVRNPTVATLPKGSRVYEAIEAAGGLADDADLSALNRAAVLEDGEKVYVPTASQEPEGGSGEPSSSQEPALVNINLADVDELDALPGIGPATAQAIVDDRAANGRFASAEDLMRVSGIGEKKFEKLATLICA
ncbi:helix-hairpin-helix domain-containing protein [Collinsella tanakaei]|uniref:helix-hairpin-helix domain-containing protein n=1 Tax=Collinsella tanakaei TaxID=626935 RepID=UPI0025A31890|nr:helix-hairpin-helix domain-containing protein [Collinsella tanakaei]MDM8299770.1 helix-hairpin-helix domain-containing protein [Collinsella tanakaei]